jgi:hypothetical protein
VNPGKHKRFKEKYLGIELDGINLSNSEDNDSKLDENSYLGA